MPPYEKMYYHLFNAITDALNKLEAHKYSDARKTLIAAQQWGENMYIEMTDTETIPEKTEHC